MSVPIANTLPPSSPDAHAVLSSRELDYLARLALNSTRKRIAAEDGISVGRVSQIVDGAMRKLDSDTLIDTFRRLGWLTTGRR